MKPGKMKLDGKIGDMVVVYERDTKGELHVMHYMNEQGYEVMTTAWYPSEDEIRAMIDGSPVQLHIVGNHHPWVKVIVKHD
jgi:hypothetical protein